MFQRRSRWSPLVTEKLKTSTLNRPQISIFLVSKLSLLRSTCYINHYLDDSQWLVQKSVWVERKRKRGQITQLRYEI